MRPDVVQRRGRSVALVESRADCQQGVGLRAGGRAGVARTVEQALELARG